jgi:uncharacterized metal-binding protein YceD (DUF177 family)
MNDGLPLSHSTNLARLGNAGDRVTFAADEAQRAALARWSGVMSVESFAVTVDIAKLGPVHFALDFTIAADVTQACVVTLEPVPSHMARSFRHELHFTGTAPRHRQQPESPVEVLVDADLDEGPEEIESLHYDLAGPALEDYVLALEPYPRCPGVAFTAPEEASGGPESPFAVLKGLKSGL